MSNWTSGYVSEINYTIGYYPELNPLLMKLALLNAGVEPPEVITACELGFGQGLSVNIHSAGSDVHWYGNDFLPSQAGFAEQLAQRSGNGAQLSDDSFAEFLARDDLPDFDFIAMHGIWSWVSDENRELIARFIHRKLKTGGVVFVSYNVLPGWASTAPLRNLMADHVAYAGSAAAGMNANISGALDFAEQLLSIEPRYLQHNPVAAERLETIRHKEPEYLAHEYFNQDWHPFYFRQVAEVMDRAKLTYACSAQLLDHVDMINFTPEQQQFLFDINDPVFRETVRDYIVNRPFRRDFWIKGRRPISRHQSLTMLLDYEFTLSQRQENISLVVQAGLGEITLKEEMYSPVLALFFEHPVLSFSQLINQLSDQGFSANQITEVLVILNSIGVLSPVQPPAVREQRAEVVYNLNTQILERAIHHSDIHHLASPLTGSALMVSRFEQLFVLARRFVEDRPTELAGFVWNILKDQGQQLVRDGRALESDADNLAELKAKAEAFKSSLLPLLERHGIA